ncbi:hypothetical protein B9J88_05650 [Vibrio sp. V05_P4A8T149]|nr:hypothetical protein B9J86_09870 [Vibrio sp. V06_P1A73T115]OXX24491.1 hypothetical protein B9J88_05650 [Vibrio sp. V05_P4A8T149]OXX30141.1 hypothetical protein B9J81_16700 [Vibrio sp. V04_P4A5T148]OXX51629.1 hypothetical protein B9J91_16775 [Vibrio sp. V18_P1S4T112]
MVEVIFKHYGYSGSLTASEPSNISKIQECITLANREALLMLILSFLINLEAHRTSEFNTAMAAIQIAELYKVSEVLFV